MDLYAFITLIAPVFTANAIYVLGMFSWYIQYFRYPRVQFTNDKALWASLLVLSLYMLLSTPRWTKLLYIYRATYSSWVEYIRSRHYTVQ